MSRTTTAIEWMSGFHDASGGKTSELIAMARDALEDAPADVRSVVVDEGLRQLSHLFRRTSAIRTSTEAETLPMFVSLEEADGTVVHRPRWAVQVAAIDGLIQQWTARRDQALREASWWEAQRAHAIAAGAMPTATLLEVWRSLGIEFEAIAPTG